MLEDFKEISHSGGVITFSIRTGEDGQRSVGILIRGTRPVPSVMIGVYAIAQGIPVATMSLAGMGIASDPPPFSGCYPVMVSSDSEGHFGHNCPRCNSYWRSGPWPRLCPYCNWRGEGHQFLSSAQLRFVKHYCEVMTAGMDSTDNGDVVIDMDVVADAVGKELADKPEFYIAEENQQYKFKCSECEEFNDILGRFAYCSLCGTRNDLTFFVDVTISTIRERLNAGVPPENCVRDAVAAFDSLVAQYAKQLAEQIPLAPRRIHRLTRQSFHDLDDVLKILRDWFDIDLSNGMKPAEFDFVRLMFCRRHIYEHNGGEVDQKYINSSGDTSVRLKQIIRETKDATHSLLGSLLKMGRNLHTGFHLLIEVEQEPIARIREKKKRMADWQQRQDD